MLCRMQIGPEDSLLVTALPLTNYACVQTMWSWEQPAESFTESACSPSLTQVRHRAALAGVGPVSHKQLVAGGPGRFDVAEARLVAAYQPGFCSSSSSTTTSNKSVH